MSDVDLQLKKRSRRRLIGAAALAGLAAVVLPLVMDEEPKQQAQPVKILIPSQDQPSLLPMAALPSDASVTEKNLAADKPAKESAPPSANNRIGRPADTKPPSRPAEKPQSRPGPTERSQAKAEAKPVARDSDEEAKRVMAILSGQPDPTASSGAATQNEGRVEHIILIGAFANPANVRQLQKSLGDLGIPTFTEPFDSPAGMRTRVRAGPFPSREAAENALTRMKRVGVNGVLATR